MTDCREKKTSACYSTSIKYLATLQILPSFAEVDMVTGKSTPPEDIVFISDQTIEKLTHGLLAHYLPDLQDSKQALQELRWVT